MQVAFEVGLEAGVGSGPSEMWDSRGHRGRMAGHSRRSGLLEEGGTLCSSDSSETCLRSVSPPAKG